MIFSRLAENYVCLYDVHGRTLFLGGLGLARIEIGGSMFFIANLIFLNEKRHL